MAPKKQPRAKRLRKGFKMKTRTFFTVDFINKEIKGTKSAFNKASKGYGDAYEELTARIQAHPDFNCVVIEPKKHSSKPKATYEGLTLAFVKDYVAMIDSPKHTQEMNNIIAYCKNLNEKPLPKLKSWMIETFKYDYADERFSMAAAKDEVREWKLEKAKAGEPASANSKDEALADAIAEEALAKAS